MKTAFSLFFCTAVSIFGIDIAYGEDIDTATGICRIDDADRTGFGRKIYDADSCISRNGRWIPRNNPDAGTPLPPIKQNITNTIKGNETNTESSTPAVSSPPQKPQPEEPSDIDVDKTLTKCRAKLLPDC